MNWQISLERGALVQNGHWRENRVQPTQTDPWLKSGEALASPTHNSCHEHRSLLIHSLLVMETIARSLSKPRCLGFNCGPNFNLSRGKEHEIMKFGNRLPILYRQVSFWEHWRIVEFVLVLLNFWDSLCMPINPEYDATEEEEGDKEGWGLAALAWG